MRHDDQALRKALDALGRVARRRLARHPQAHLAQRGTGDSVASLRLDLRVPTVPRDALLDDATAEVSAALDREIESLVAHGAAFQPGRVFCLRCASTECEHAVPPSPNHVFAGYGPTGQPRFLALPQWLLECGDERVDQLFDDKVPALVALTTSGRDLASDLLPAFRDQQTDYRIHGQVAAGWFRVATGEGPPVRLALTFQVVSSAGTGTARRLGLNLLGAGPDGATLEAVVAKANRVPWAEVARNAERTLADIEASQGQPKATPERLSARIEGVLESVRRRLERGRRSRNRRTQHAQERHRQGERPTAMAQADLRRARDESILIDRRRDTVIVLGERGRAHVFSRAGKLVTSLRVTPESIERRRATRRWRGARSDEIAAVRRAAAATPEAR